MSQHHLWSPPAGLMDTIAEDDRDALEYLRASTPPQGNRRLMLRKLTHAMARLGATNHQIMQVLEDRADAWGVLPRTNLWRRYSFFVDQISDARESLSAGPRPRND